MLITDWNYAPLLTPHGDESAFAQERIEAMKHIDAFVETYRKDKGFLKEPAKLAIAIKEFEELETYYIGGGNEGYFYSLKSYINQNDPEILAKYSKVEEFSLDINNKLSFFELEIAKIKKEHQNKFLTHPDLAIYHHLLERLFDEAKYLLSENEEKILSLKSKTAYGNWVDMVSRFLSKEEAKILNKEGKKETKSFSEIPSMFENPVKSVRDDAAKNFNIILKKHLMSAEIEVNSILHDKKVNDSLRGLEKPYQARILGDNMEEATVMSLMKEVTDAFDIPKRYYKLKAELLGVKKLQYHERSLAYGSTEKSYTVDECFSLVLDTLTSLDPLFGSIMGEFMEKGAYDVYPKKDKYSGAFCIHMLPPQPTYLLLNFTGKLNDVLTLAHETGHGINYELTKQTQNALNFGVYTSTAEVASTFMEDFVLDTLLKEADDELRLALMVQKLNDDVSTIFRQIAAFNFELELHTSFREKGYLTNEEIGGIFQKHMVSYMGDSVEQTKGAENWWVYWSHFRNFFYVYTYASGLLISKSLQASVREDPAFIHKVKKFFSEGVSDSPYNMFMKMGIDINDSQFWKKGIKEIEAHLDETIALAKKLGRIA